MGRAPCCDKNGLKKGPWTQEEDSKLMQYIQENGPGNWRILPKNAGLQRCGKSCRLRWTNYLRPDIKRGRFSFEEEETIIQLHRVLGNKWSAIAARLPGRTDNEIKNYWNTHIRKRLIRMGVDPVTHSPRLDFLDLSSLLGSAQLNLSNLLGLQTMVNPELLRLANLLKSSHENQDLSLLLHTLQQQQLGNNINGEVQNRNQYPNCQNITQMVPPTILNQTQVMEGNNGHLFPTNLGFENFHENQTPSSVIQNINGYSSSCMADQIPTNESDEYLLSRLMSNVQNVKFESTPLSSSTPTPLNSSSTFINSSSTEDDKDSFCSNMFKFEIPENFSFEEFLM